jgi:TonB family protein
VPTPAKIVRPVNPENYYPRNSLRSGEAGAPIVQACVDKGGKLIRQPVVTQSSGYPNLDAAALRVAKDTRYAAAVENGSALPESCITFKIKFALPVDAGIARPVNPDNYYPPDSKRRGESGGPIVKVCVGPDGEPLREPEVTESSGFPDLDAAAITVAKAVRYQAGKINDIPQPESCIRFKVQFGSKPADGS